MKAYYAHHIWKYGTAIEEYELSLIKEAFPAAEIFNPAVSIPQGLSDEEAMKLCLSEVESSDVLIFSSVDGIVGRGVHLEVLTARTKIPVFYIHKNKLAWMRPRDGLTILPNGTNRIYATVEVEE